MSGTILPLHQSLEIHQSYGALNADQSPKWSAQVLTIVGLGILVGTFVHVISGSRSTVLVVVPAAPSVLASTRSHPLPWQIQKPTRVATELDLAKQPWHGETQHATPGLLP